MESENQTFFRGEFIVAMPSLKDQNFHRAVVCICEHSNQGALGLIVNKVYPKLYGREVFESLGLPYTENAARMMIYYGGPVQVDRLFVLHGPPFNWEGCFQVTGEVALSNTIDIIQAIAMEKGPDKAVITAGCSGWGPGQLEVEIAQNSWLSCPLLNDIIFTQPIDKRWICALKSMGVDPFMLSDEAGMA